VNPKELLGEVESSRDEVTELCSELVKIPTPNPPGDTVRCVSFIEDYFKKQGVPTQTFQRAEGKASIVARIHGRSPHRILWLGHIDVVPEGNLEYWKHEPYGGEVENDHVYGRGSSDMKGSCGAAMVAAKILHRAGKIPHNVEFWFTCDEEIGGGDGAQWLAKDGLIKGDVCIIGDSSGSTPSKPYVDVGCKGILWTRVHVGGKTAHGSQPYLGENAVDKVLTLAPHIKKMGNYRLDTPVDLKPALRSSIRFLLSKESLTEEQKRATKRVFDYPTIALNVISGGVKINVVPDAAEAHFDIRLTPGVDLEKVKSHLQQLIDSSGVREVKTEFIQVSGGYYESPKSAFSRQLGKTIQKVTGAKPVYKVLTGGTDAVSLKKYQGIPCLGFGAGVEGQAHAPEEHVPIDDLVMASKVYTAFPFNYKAV
jgi:succinyl-diaminopimelate desuccinylase